MSTKAAQRPAESAGDVEFVVDVDDPTRHPGGAHGVAAAESPRGLQSSVHERVDSEQDGVLTRLDLNRAWRGTQSNP